jgi:hypothetical protein
MTPIFSGVCRSTDSEAMNIVQVIDEVKEICGDGVKIYTGNGHTTTKISAGMVFLSHGVIAAGRFKTEITKNLDEGSILLLKKNITLLNKIGKLLKDEPEPGRVMAMRKYVYVDNIEVRKMVEDLGYLILKEKKSHNKSYAIYRAAFATLSILSFLPMAYPFTSRLDAAIISSASALARVFLVPNDAF